MYAEPELTELRPGDGIRWAVGSKDGRRSSTWRFWGNKKGDFYLSVRTLGGILKTSLHRDGRCQTGFTREYARRTTLNRPRHLDEWKLPESPVVRAVQVIIPAEELDVYSAKEAEPMMWLPSPPAGSASIVSVFIVQPDAVVTDGERWPGESVGALLIGLAATRLRVAFVIAMTHPLPESVRETIEGYRARTRGSAGSQGVRPEPGMRFSLFGQEGDAPRYIIELAYRG